MRRGFDGLLAELFELDLEAEVGKIVRAVREQLSSKLRKRGLVVGLSGGIDSSVCAALGAAAVGPGKVLGLLMPERDSSPESTSRGRAVADHLGIPSVTEDIAPTLEAIGCYRWRDQAFGRVFPGYGPGWRSKIVITGGMEGKVNHFKLVVMDPEGTLREAPLGLRDYLEIVAATNHKQRIRKTLEYFHADRLNYAVLGTPNRAEYDQGFFVRNGDGAADLKPIAHLYKTQVYALGRHLGLPEEVCEASPTTDTYSLAQGHDEFYYGLPYQEMDVALKLLNDGRPASELAELLGVDPVRAEWIYADIETKRRTTAPLHWPALLVENVPGPHPFRP